MGAAKSLVLKNRALLDLRRYPGPVHLLSFHLNSISIYFRFLESRTLASLRVKMMFQSFFRELRVKREEGERTIFMLSRKTISNLDRVLLR